VNRSITFWLHSNGLRSMLALAKVALVSEAGEKLGDIDRLCTNGLKAFGVTSPLPSTVHLAATVAQGEVAAKLIAQGSYDTWHELRGNPIEFGLLNVGLVKSHSYLNTDIRSWPRNLRAALGRVPVHGGFLLVRHLLVLPMPDPVQKAIDAFQQACKWSDEVAQMDQSPGVPS
jgi:hypothetical protein